MGEGDHLGDNVWGELGLFSYITPGDRQVWQGVISPLQVWAVRKRGWSYPARGSLVGSVQNMDSGLWTGLMDWTVD